MDMLFLNRFTELILPPGVSGTCIDLTGLSSSDEDMF